MSAGENAVVQVADQAERDRALDTSQSICVTAPAGSGKTELLTQRFLKLLALVEQPEKILAMTFTRKAAAEMRERISSALQRAASGEPPSQAHQRKTWELATRALEQDGQFGWNLLLNPSRLRVQTIDSLCQRIASDNPILSQFGRRPAAVDDAAHLYEIAVDEMLERVEESSPLGDAIRRLQLHHDNNVFRLRKLLVELLPVRDQWLHNAVNFEDGDETRQALEQVLDKWIAKELSLLQQALQPYASDLCLLADFAGSNLVAAGETHLAISKLAGITGLPDTDPAQFTRWQGLLDLLLTQKGELRKAPRNTEGFPPASAAGDKETKAHYAGQKNLAKELFSLIAADSVAADQLKLCSGLPVQGYTAAQWDVLAPVCQCLVQAYAHLRLVFGRTGECDHQEIASSALLALQGAHGDAGQGLRWDRSLQHILVDEFQDTSVTQFKLLERLTAEWQQRNRLNDSGQPNTLFVVGDGMQSIYRFRAARVGLFLAARSTGVGDLPLQAVNLSQNFRSTQAIVDWNNQVFSQVFPQQTDISRGAVPYYSSQGPGDKGTKTNAVKMLGCVQEEGRSVEAAQVVSSIEQIRQQAADEDIAILVRSRSHLEEILPALDDAGIDWLGVDIDSLRSRETVMDCLSLTRALCNPADSLAWAAVFRAPWCGLSLADLEVLASYSEQDKSRAGDVPPATSQPTLRKSINTILNNKIHDKNKVKAITSAMSPDGASRFNWIAGLLHAVWAERNAKPLRHWVEGAWRALRGDALAKQSVDGDDLDSALAYFDLLETLDTEGAAGASGFDFQRLEKKISSLYARPPAATGQQQAVQIMTIHKSKGLEFDHVILPGLDRPSKGDSKALLAWSEHLFDDGQTGLVLCPLDSAQSARSDRGSLYTFLREEEKRSGLLEGTRLMYVAATRAKKSLCLLANLQRESDESFKSPAAKSPLERIWPAVQGQFEIHEFTAVDSAEPLQNEALDDAYPMLKRVSPAVIPAEGFSVTLQHGDDGAATRQHDEINGSEGGEDSGNGQAYSAEQITGICVHEILEQISLLGVERWQQKALDSRLPAFTARLRQLGMLEGDLGNALELVVQAVQTSCDSSVGRWILQQQPDAASEWKLSSQQPGDPAPLRFVIDRSFIDEQGRRWIIDYKNTQPGKDEDSEAFVAGQKQRYREQLANYCEILGRMEDRETSCALYFPLLGRMETVEI